MTQSSRSLVSGRTILAVEGMTCGSCVEAVRQTLSWVPGVEHVEVERASGLAVVDGEAMLAEMLSALTAAGFGASVNQDGGAGTAPSSGGCCR